MSCFSENKDRKRMVKTKHKAQQQDDDGAVVKQELQLIQVAKKEFPKLVPTVCPINNKFNSRNKEIIIEVCYQCKKPIGLETTKLGDHVRLEVLFLIFFVFFC